MGELSSLSPRVPPTPTPAPGKSWLRALLIGSLTTLSHSGYGPSTQDPTSSLTGKNGQWKRRVRHSVIRV